MPFLSVHSSPRAGVAISESHGTAQPSLARYSSRFDRDDVGLGEDSFLFSCGKMVMEVWNSIYCMCLYYR